MFVLETGGGRPGAVLLLHALGLDHRMWRGFIEDCGDVRVLAPDLPGLGRSRAEPSGLDSAVGACAAVLRSSDRGAVVIGVSYGGYVAALLAARHPDLVAGLALSGVRRRVPPLAAHLQTALFRGVRSSSLGQGDHTVPKSALANEKRNLISASIDLGRVDLSSALPRIVAPTVVFAPSRDWFVRRDVPHLAAMIKDVTIVPVPGAGHLWVQSTPQPLIDATHDLIGRASASKDV